MHIVNSYVSDCEIEKLALSAVADGLRMAGYDTREAKELERELGVYYLLRDDIYASILAAYERMARSVFQCIVDGMLPRDNEYYADQQMALIEDAMARIEGSESDNDCEYVRELQLVAQKLR